jgi:hypothetical protein
VGLDVEKEREDNYFKDLELSIAIYYTNTN